MDSVERIVSKFFTVADDDEVIFEWVNSYPEMQNMLSSFRYHIKDRDEASDHERDLYQNIVLRHENPLALLSELEHKSYVDAVQALMAQ
ncbi:hypothetical protein A134_11130 [Vibrio crassostreae 9CS106]|nr:hypothetical protein A134_11130 [Vibrio crassostreae 9CS106]